MVPPSKSSVCIFLIGLEFAHCLSKTAAPALKTVDEAWGYVDFLNNLSDDVENILTDTLGSTNIINQPEIITEATDKVIDIRQKILDRIRELRIGEILINPKQNIQQEINLSGFRIVIMDILMDIVDTNTDVAVRLERASRQLLNFRTMNINQEKMRILMLDTASPALDVGGCDIEDKLNRTVHNLIDCAESEGGRRDCYATDLYAMVLISANDGIDKEIIQLYRSIITTNDRIKRKKYRRKLDSLNEVRQSLEDVVRELIDDEDNHQNIRRIVIDSLREGFI